MGKEEEIFSDKFEQKKDDIEHSEFTPIPPTDEPDDKKPKKIVISNDGIGKKHPKRTAGIVGAVIIGVIIIMAYFLVAQNLGFEPLDPTQCNFGIVGGSMLTPERCMTQEEYQVNEDAKQRILERELEREKEGTTTKPPDEPFKDVTQTSDKVEVDKSKEPIGYYMVTTTDDWYGDFVDIRKVPSKIEKSGSMKINFRCFTDEFQGTSTYFATFRNVIDSNLTVEVYINGIEVETQTTNVNKALILEGSCYGHES
ncbi:MAG: hypothetical protein KJI69_03960 [Patescibacteria group bacterium]|nr:hypothetical protein [Patescibacteria group bacterium]